MTTMDRAALPLVPTSPPPPSKERVATVCDVHREGCLGWGHDFVVPVLMAWHAMTDNNPLLSCASFTRNGCRITRASCYHFQSSLESRCSLARHCVNIMAFQGLPRDAAMTATTARGRAACRRAEKLSCAEITACKQYSWTVAVDHTEDGFFSTKFKEGRSCYVQKILHMNSTQALYH